MTKPVEEIDERIFTLSDVRALFRKKQAKVLQIALLAGIASFGLCLLKAPKYKIEATFKEEIENNGSEGLFKEMIVQMGGSSSQPEAAVLMKSYQVLKPLVARFGLQASISQGWIIAKVCRRIRDNFKAERGKLLEEPDNFVFRDVIYEGENGLSYFLRFDDLSHFAVLESNKKVIAQGILGAEVCLPEAQFILQKTPKNIRLHRLYSLNISPWVPIAQELRGNFKITSQKTNKSIYDVICFHRSRFRGVALVNELMVEYQRYLKRNHDQLSKAQIAYLDERQEEVSRKVAESFKERAKYFSQNLERMGVADLKNGMEGLLSPYRQMSEKAFNFDIELSRLNQFKEGDVWLPFGGNDSFSRRFIEISDEIVALKQQRDLLELSLHNRDAFSEQQLQTKQQELKEIRSRFETSKKLLTAIEQNQGIDFSFDPGFSLAFWAKNLEISSGEGRQDLISYLENHIRLLSLREKMLQERFFYSEETPLEFEGIDLSTAQKLFVEYNNRLDLCEASMRHYAELQKEIELPDFEISSLSAILEDPLSQKLISQAGELSVQLKDEKHHSEKEDARWREELNLQKKILKEHLEQLFKVEELNTSLIREKIAGLQRLSLDCINRQISVLREQTRNAIEESRESLLNEKKFLNQKMADLRASMTDLPELWSLEEWIHLKTEMGVKCMQTITGLVESKAISHHLHHIGSKPLDPATLPMAPQSPYLFRKGLLGAFLAGFGIFFFLLLQAILRGFPSSFEKLRAMRFPLLGEISSFCDGPQVDFVSGGDLEVLRGASLFFEKPPQAKVVALLAGKGPDYSYALAENLSKMALRSLVIRCDFHAKYQEKDTPGLLQAWKKEIEELPIRTVGGFDLLTAGGFTPYGNEIIQSKTFEQLLSSLKEKYDYLFLLFRSPLDKTESKTVLRICDKAIVTVSGEPTEMLTPFIDWAYHQEEPRLTFMTLQPT